MGTVFEIRAYNTTDSDVIQNAEDELYACEDLISWRKEGSLADLFNSEHEADMSSVRELIETALQMSRDSNGAFDLTVLPLSKLWNFDRLEDEDFDVSEMQVPDAKTIAGTIKDIGYQKLVYDEQTGILSTDELSLEIELGAIGKGYAIEQAMKIVKASNASGGMISAGSSICVYGTKTDGSSFRVALRDPRGETDSYIGLLNVSDCSISTSGDYERYFEQDGIRYHHILDPRTGYPADSGLMQVTIICDDSMTGDALSTACFVLGLDDGMALASQYGVKAIFVDTDKNVWYNDADILDILDFYGEDAGYILQEYQ
jgi:thiamine biosynthesis lipoprotein